MHHSISLCLLTLASAAFAQAPALDGNWMGTLDVGAAKLRLVIHVTQSPSGMTATMDSIDQGTNGMKIDTITLTGSTVHFELRMIQGSYDGAVKAGGSEINGQWKQGGAELPLTLKRVDKAPEVTRPQDPKKPYPYAEHEVSYENKAGGVKLAGTLTIPPGKGPFPAVLLITGSGPQDRNETLLGHQPFLILSDYLTRRGIAILRVDDRGVGGSTGSTSNSTTQDFVGDVLTGVKFLESRKEINPRRIGLCGHSEGGLIAPMAASRSKDVAFVVMMAGTGVTGEEILYAQGRLIAKAMGQSDADIDRGMAINRRLYSFIKKDGGAPDAEAKIQPLLDEIKAGLTEQDRKKAEAAGSFSAAAMKSLISPWF